MKFPRFYPILDVAAAESSGLSIVDAARVLLEAGARILQLRHKGSFTRARFDEARLISGLALAAGATFIVNDRADIAVALDGGVHVGQDDLAPADARLVIGPSRMLGFSTHNEQQMREAVREPVDYVAFGPVFPTASKLNPDPTVGLEQLRAIRALTRLPLIAIGGITREMAASVFDAGADSIAVIGDLFRGADLKERAEQWLAMSS